ncbi:MAG: thiosulfate oxidation carrier protein SoxY [Nitrospinota bacterium]
MAENWKMTRRVFMCSLALAGAGGALGILGGGVRNAVAIPALGGIQKAKDPKNLSLHEKSHLPDIQLPLIAEDGSNVPIIIDMHHEQKSADYIKTIEIFNFNDPVISKGIYHFTPAAGQVHFSTQLRMNGGDANVYVVIECTKHGKWVAHKSLKVSVGGC